MQTPTHVFFLFEGNIHSYRQIFVDGRKHPADPNPQWYGHSVGRWEGDTLVVDTIGFNDRAADDEELMEYICNENAKDVSRLVGKDPRNKYSKEKP